MPAYLILLPYLIGLAAGFFLILVSTWADMEASVYGFPRQAHAGLKGFSCPILMTRRETGRIAFTISNTTDGKISPFIKFMASTPVMLEEHSEDFDLAPGESRALEWQVDSENIDLGQFIFAKVLVISAYPLPTQEASCGIFVLNLPVSGRTTLWLLIATSLIGMGWGLYAMSMSRRAAGARLAKYLPALAFLSIAILLGFIFVFAGAWVQSTLTLAVILLLSVILLVSFLMAAA